MKLQPKHVVMTILVLAGLLMSVLTASFAYYTNEGFGFPLDDPWIHLQFAKNLHDYGSFSYFKNEIFKTEKAIGVGDLGKTIFAPIECLDSSNFDSA